MRRVMVPKSRKPWDLMPFLATKAPRHLRCTFRAPSGGARLPGSVRHGMGAAHAAHGSGAQSSTRIRHVSPATLDTRHSLAMPRLRMRALSEQVADVVRREPDRARTAERVKELLLDGAAAACVSRAFISRQPYACPTTGRWRCGGCNLFLATSCAHLSIHVCGVWQVLRPEDAPLLSSPAAQLRTAATHGGARAEAGAAPPEEAAPDQAGAPAGAAGSASVAHAPQDSCCQLCLQPWAAGQDHRCRSLFWRLLVLDVSALPGTHTSPGLLAPADAEQQRFLSSLRQLTAHVACVAPPVQSSPGQRRATPPVCPPAAALTVTHFVMADSRMAGAGRGLYLLQAAAAWQPLLFYTGQVVPAPVVVGELTAVESRNGRHVLLHDPAHVGGVALLANGAHGATANMEAGVVLQRGCPAAPIQVTHGELWAHHQPLLD